ncbi:CXXC-20-CXXC protein [Virgibacillus natechei]|uniref:CXXC-20-CXXC protein n=1 Tax=Virgibacillus natechei TaxID=1216297 RepID=A0ABS4IIV3_9BACI|nr:CXXC-20-CXXC protein [Virgibacillus natechei]
MARCTNCNYKWEVKAILLIGFSKYGKNCPNCQHKQCISSVTQRILTLGYLSLIFVPFLLFFVKISDKDEPLW